MKPTINNTSFKRKHLSRTHIEWTLVELCGFLVHETMFLL